jgi:hypothetical protein
MMRE